ncbi:MAG: hypothetical protein PVI78_06565 [Anaerolineales bacterium]|jgi:hypothetical protein
MTPEWEYGVETLGTIWRSPSPDDLARLLNAAAFEGWEPVSVVSLSSGNRLLVILRRPLTKTTRKRRTTWP